MIQQAPLIPLFTGSGRIVDQPNTTQFWGYFLLGGDSLGTNSGNLNLILASSPKNRVVVALDLTIRSRHWSGQ